MPPVRKPLLRRKPSTLVSTWGGTFYPTMFASLQLWFDSSDLSTITASGGLVSQWNDKSGNGYHVTQGTDVSKPTTGSVTKNGLNVLTFAANKQLLRTTATGLGQNVSGTTIYAVHRLDSGSAVREVMRYNHSDLVNTRAGLRLTGTTVFGAVGRTLDADALQTASSSAQTLGGYRIQCGAFDYGNLRLRQYFEAKINGFLTPYQSATTTSNTASGRLAVGSSGSSSNYWDGAICEILIYHAVHNEPEISAVNDYLNRKWAIY